MSDDASHPNPWLEKVVAAFRAAFGFVRRVAVVVGVPLLAAVAGFALVTKLLEPSGQNALRYLASQLGNDGDAARIATNLRYGVAALGAGLLVGVVRELAAQVPSLLDYLKEKGIEHVLAPSAAVFGASACLALSLWALTAEAAASPPTLPPVSAPPLRFLFDSTDHEETPRTPRAAFLVTFGEDATADSIDAESGAGLGISESDRQLLKSLATTLAQCATPEAAPVELKLVGMASSEPFKTYSLAESNEMNRKLANLRARLVADAIEEYLQEAESAPRIVVTPHVWRAYEDMVQSRRFRDRNLDGSYNEERARLTRRVEVSLEHAGGCEFSMP